MLDVWLFALDHADFGASLSPDERDRAARFRFARDRQRFVARRGQLRRLLGDYLARPAADIAFDHNAFGKPTVRGAGDLSFSTSHSGTLGLCVVAHGTEVGCDLERRQPHLADRATAKHLFAPGEQRALATLPAEQWIEGFFNCWTRKEAYVKALGLGLSHPLDGFEVSLAPDAPATLLSGADCAMHAFAPDADHHAAIVALDPAQGMATPRWLL